MRSNQNLAIMPINTMASIGLRGDYMRKNKQIKCAVKTVVRARIVPVYVHLKGATLPAHVAIASIFLIN